LSAREKPVWTRSLTTFLIIFALGGYLVLRSRGCRPPQQGMRPPDARIVQVKIGADVVKAEVADTPELRLKGLSGRSRLEPGHGMLFVFDEPCKPDFWMRGTAIPLSIAFIKDDGAIVRIARMEPNDLRRVAPDQPVRYALEVRQGWFEDHGISAGAKAELPAEIPPPPAGRSEAPAESPGPH